MPPPHPKLSVAPATEAHAEQLAADLRPEDAAEMMASHGLAPLEGLRMAVRSSSSANAVLSGERVVALFGVAPMTPDAASVWMLTGRLAKRLSVTLTRTMAVELRKLVDAWPVLFNMVWAQNKLALRWVRSLGFEVLDPVPFGVSGEPFRPILFRRV